MSDPSQEQLLRRFEPVLRFNRGERFFPMDVGAFVRHADLWERSGKGASRIVARGDELSLKVLDRFRPGGERDVLFLRASAPMPAADIARHAMREKRRTDDPRDAFRAGRGRLARVGYTSRFVDALFSLSLYARGRVPGDLAASAVVTYREEMRESETYRYYGHVIERGPWMVLQYWYFYFFNDWRSHFFGTNDHEGDWEMISIFLDARAPGGPRPEWIACSCHEYAGADLRRRWDDDGVEKRGDHPVVYVGAGSHAGYYRSGDYLAEIELPALKPAMTVARAARSFWRDAMHQYGPTMDDRGSKRRDPSFGVPFVDYARGDGHGIGDGEERSWSDPGLLRPDLPWVRFRGLWGYFAADPLAGEDAPTGPMYNRDGSVRAAWQDPVAWCGLLGVPPSSRRDVVVASLREELVRERRERAETVHELREELERVGLERSVAHGKPHLTERARELTEREHRLVRRLADAQDAVSTSDDIIEALEHDAWESGVREPRALQPLSPQKLRAGKLAEVWAALSIGILLLGLVILATFAREHLVWGSAVLLVWYVAIESLFRNRLISLVTGSTVVLALVSAAVLVVEFYRPLAIGLAVGIGLFLLWENIRELWT